MTAAISRTIRPARVRGAEGQLEPGDLPGRADDLFGDRFPDWRGNAFIGGLSSEALIRVAIDGTSAREVARYAMGSRIRDVEQGPDGAVYVIEDGTGGRLLRLTPRGQPVSRGGK
jgi:hypothetical protein